MMQAVKVKPITDDNNVDSFNLAKDLLGYLDEDEATSVRLSYTPSRDVISIQSPNGGSWLYVGNDKDKFMPLWDNLVNKGNKDHLSLTYYSESLLQITNTDWSENLTGIEAYSEDSINLSFSKKQPDGNFIQLP